MGSGKAPLDEWLDLLRGLAEDPLVYNLVIPVFSAAVALAPLVAAVVVPVAVEAARREGLIR